MKFKTLSLSAVALAFAVFMLASCSMSVVHRTRGSKIGHGPAPHAPAHGFRRKQRQGVDLIFDSGSGVYVVVGLEKHYYLSGYYYRFCNDRWEVSAELNGMWKPVCDGSLPRGLRGKHKGKHVSKAHPGRGCGLQGKSKW